MANLSHWDFAKQFSGYEAAALILGFEPTESEEEQGRIRVITSRMELHYKAAFSRIFHENFGNPIETVEKHRDAVDGELVSVELDRLLHRAFHFDEEVPLESFLGARSASSFERQEFSRTAISQWLAENGFKSAYQFELSQPALTNREEESIDPSDFPEELQAANIAFRAVTNGFGDPLATFKNRLVEYLEKNYRHLKSEAIQRIATVANPDKSTGRKRRDKL